MNIPQTFFLTFDKAGVVTGTGCTPDGTLPDRAIQCTSEQAAAWQGSTVQNGAIVASTVSVFEITRTAELSQFRVQRELFLNRLAGIGLAAQAAGKADVLASTLAVRQGLLDLPKDAGVTAATDLPKLKAAIDASIQKLAKTAKPEVASIFKTT